MSPAAKREGEKEMLLLTTPKTLRKRCSFDFQGPEAGFGSPGGGGAGGRGLISAIDPFVLITFTSQGKFLLPPPLGISLISDVSACQRQRTMLSNSPSTCSAPK